MANEPPPTTNPILDAYKSFVDRTPLVTRYLLTVQAASYLLSWFVDPTYALAATPRFLVHYLEIYRLVTSWLLVNTNLLSLVFGFVSFTDHGQRLEYGLGSTIYGCLCLTLGVVSASLYVTTSLIVYGLTSNAEWLISSPSGIFIVLFGLIAMDCAQAPADQTKPLFCYQLPTIYYPVVLFLVFSLFGGGSSSLIYAYSLTLGYGLGWGRLEWIKLSASRAKRWEDACLSPLRQRHGWVTGHAARGSDVWSDAASSGMSLPIISSSRQRESTLATTAMVENEPSSGTAGSVFRSGKRAKSLGATASTLSSAAGGQALGGTERRGKGDARTARLQALERQQQEAKASEGV